MPGNRLVNGRTDPEDICAGRGSLEGKSGHDDGPGAPRSTSSDERRSSPFLCGAATGPVSGPQIRVRTRQDLARQRRQRRHRCWDHIIAAPLWPLHDANLGTLLRTCDAVGACLAVPRLPWVSAALARGNTLRRPACVHWVGRDVCRWLEEQRSAGTRIVGVELTEESVRLGDLAAARQRTIAVLGHEQTGIPPEAVDLLDVAVEIPMIGSGQSLNVAVAGSLVLYRLAGLL
jgi:tRNA (guanosine-2'-O-)-methyltransferase